MLFLLLKGKTVEQRFVETGIVGDVDYEIISGLEEGKKLLSEVCSN
ncbi:MAG: hypothetical protein Ct9H300mP24_7080 [Candidatus Neomarinimicrobiota bacterium]|nr:MAG: hypothetical protein Ct9H300mP24_7080 [Candidatus Neomarinimicrobiota bacterium]